MTVTINGTTGIAGVDGSAATPAVQGVDTNTGVFYGTDIVGISTGGTERMRIDSSGNVGIGGTPANGMLELFKASGEAVLRINSTAASSWVTFNPSIAAYLHNVTATPMIFTTNATERMRIASNGDLSFNSGYGSAAVAYGCRAWVNFDGTGTVAIRASGNVSSIADNGVGLYTINIDTDMPDANYSVVLTPMQQSAGTNGLTATNILTQTAGVITISNGDTSGNSYNDSSIICAAIFR